MGERRKPQRAASSSHSAPSSRLGGLASSLESSIVWWLIEKITYSKSELQPRSRGGVKAETTERTPQRREKRPNSLSILRIQRNVRMINWEASSRTLHFCEFRQNRSLLVWKKLHISRRSLDFQCSKSLVQNSLQSTNTFTNSYC
jgi:hypothetical protein